MTENNSKIGKIIGERINKLCAQKSMSYYKLSERSGVPLNIIMRIRSGDTENQDLCTLIKICDGLEITISELLDIDEFRKSSANKL